MKSWSSKKKKNNPDKVEARFQKGVDLVKDLDRKEFDRMIKGLTHIWQGYDSMRKVQTIDEKEDPDKDINEAERVLEKESGRNK